MTNKINHKQAKIFQIYFTQEEENNSRNEAKFRELGSWLLCVCFGYWNSFLVSQDANHALIENVLRLSIQEWTKYIF